MAELEQGFEALRRRVERLEALESTRQLLAGYCRVCDKQDMDALVELFAPDCRLDTGAEAWSGLEEITDFFRRAWAADPAPKRHFVTNVRAADVRPGTVTVDAYFLYVAIDGASSALGWGEYRDEVDVTGPLPRFRKKSILMSRSADVGHRGDLVAGTESGS